MALQWVVRGSPGAEASPGCSHFFLLLPRVRVCEWVCICCTMAFFSARRLMSSSRRLRSSSSFRFSSACCFFSASNLAWSCGEASEI